ncbi:hypothetical protein AU189_03965 [Mycolicibacterium acapulense]|uniref:Uncharacterized protein n=1 Tax=Mycobacterium lehmannii TaxID=2048550 RepID=A0A101A8Z2_9MYCO|nr:hypothetical protein [Mycobacterium lehmannii]KUH94142.1 hypothetical protein AU189_03965 [Mycolicibacterium acapulense]KUI17913.1 hypothetical protein AU192_03460 [Mycobacterium lehmannii]
MSQPYVATRRQLRGVAESLIAGPQYRSAGTIRLAVRPDGFAAVALPLSVHGTDLVFPDGSVPLAGRVQAIAEAAGVMPGPPDGVYQIVDPLPTDADLELDPDAAAWLQRSHYAGGYALKHVLPEQHPTLWPEHFDVAAVEDEVNYGVSAGDETHPTPYAYVGPWQQRTGPFWNAPFGALYPLDATHDVDTLAARITEFFERGRTELGIRP